VGRKTGVTSRRLDPAPAGSDLMGGAFSGGVAPGYYLVPLQGTKNLPFGLNPAAPRFCHHG